MGVPDQFLNSKAADVFICIFVVVVATAAFWFIWFIETGCN